MFNHKTILSSIWAINNIVQPVIHIKNLNEFLLLDKYYVGKTDISGNITYDLFYQLQSGQMKMSLFIDHTIIKVILWGLGFCS